MQISWWTLALQAVNFLVLVWLLQRFLYKPVRDILEKRKALATQALDAAAKAKSEAEAERKRYQEERGALVAERQEMLEAANWSSATKSKLPGYYNFQYDITNSVVFDIKVVAIDNKDNILDDDLLGYTKHAIYNEEIPPYNLTSDTIEKDGVTYTYKGWEYVYKDRKSETVRTVNNLTGNRRQS